MTIFIGADHAGFALKEKLKKFLIVAGFTVKDSGAFKFNKQDDYPDFALKVSRNVAREESARGILVCGSGAGVCVAANKVLGVRAVAVNTIKEAKLTREHNDANVLCLSGWHLSLPQAQKIIKAWLKTPFSGESRHVRRLEKIKRIESKISNI